MLITRGAIVVTNERYCNVAIITTYLHYHLIIVVPSDLLEITPEAVNRTPEKIGPENFDLLKVLGKGGYGKVSLRICENASILISYGCVGVSSS